MEIGIEQVRRFLKEQGYNWSGLFADNTRQSHVRLREYNAYMLDIDRKFIILEKQNDYKVGDRVNVINNSAVRFIIQNNTEFKLFKAYLNPNVDNFYSDEEILKFELVEDLSNEWIKYQIRNVKGFVEQVLEDCNYYQKEIPKRMQNRKTLMQQRIAKIKEEYSEQEQEDKSSLKRYEEIEKLVKELTSATNETLNKK